MYCGLATTFEAGTELEWTSCILNVMFEGEGYCSSNDTTQNLATVVLITLPAIMYILVGKCAIFENGCTWVCYPTKLF